MWSMVLSSLSRNFSVFETLLVISKLYFFENFVTLSRIQIYR
jgi:hypothetical protein